LALALGEENNLRVFQNRLLIIFELERDEVMGG
jgi:hypothetical protein